MPCSLYYYEATLLSDSPIPHTLQTVVHLLLIAQYAQVYRDENCRNGHGEYYILITAIVANKTEMVAVSIVSEIGG